MIDRRKFIGIAGLGAVHQLALPRFAEALQADHLHSHLTAQSKEEMLYGSGHFGEWITDQFGLPAYKYTCNQLTDPKAVTPVHKEWTAPTDHKHQVGNDRLIAVVSNAGYIQVRQDEGGPKFLNDYAPERGHFGAGIGYLTDGDVVLSTYYSGTEQSFDRIFGEGYFKKTVTGSQYVVDQVIFAPFGDDPVIVSQVTVTNKSNQDADLRWVEYWGCSNYQMDFRTYMQAVVQGDAAKAAAMRHDFGGRFAHTFQELPNGAGLLEKQNFLGYSEEDAAAWAQVVEALKTPGGFIGGELPTPAEGVAMQDLNPPPTFLVSLDAPIDGYSTDAKNFFGAGDALHPAAMTRPLTNETAASGSNRAQIVERKFNLKPNESKALYFLYGYLPDGFSVDSLIKKYSLSPVHLLEKTSAVWKQEGIRFSVPSAPWVEREIAWHNYYLRSNLTYDSFFREHILSQGNVYQYIIGFQGAARDPLQHALPFIFSQPEIVKQIIRYTLKEIQPDGSLPYGISGSGFPIPVVLHPSDQEIWLLWTAAEYVLATRDKDFLNEKIPAYPRREVVSTDSTVGEILMRSFKHLVNTIGVGEHGLMRLYTGDWNDGVVVGRVPKESIDEIHKVGESVLNAAMASYVFDHYAYMLAFVGDTAMAGEARTKAEDQRIAVRKSWTGEWFRRAWLGPQFGWLGDDGIWLEPQPWAIIGGAATADQRKTLVASLNKKMRVPSPIGALLRNQTETTSVVPPGVSENGGIFSSINGTLIWALARTDGAAAWDEWKKNSLAVHAEKYPEIWYGIWSAPDSYNSVLSDYPGQTRFVAPPQPGKKSYPARGVYWTDFPVMNMHAHAWPLYSAAKLLGLDFDESGLRFTPDLPLDEYEFVSSLLGFKKSDNGYSGWYAPAVAGQWKIEVQLPSAEIAHLRKLTINGSTAPFSQLDNTIRIQGESHPGVPLRWEIS